MSDPLARTNVEIRAPIEDLKNDLNEAKKEVESVGDAADATSKQTEDAFSKIGQSIEDTTAGARKFVGAIGSTVGILTGLTAVVSLVTVGMEKLAAGFKTSTDRAREFVDALPSGIDQLDARVAALQIKYDELNATISVNQQQLEKYSNTFGFVNLNTYIKRIEAAQKELELVEESLTATTKQREAFRDAQKKRDADSVRDAAQTEAEIIENHLLEMHAARLAAMGREGDARAVREHLLQQEHDREIERVNELGDKFSKAYGFESSAFSSLADALRRLHEMRKKMLEEEAKLAAKRWREEMEEAIRSVQQTMNTAFGPLFSDPSQIANSIDRITTALYSNRRP